MKCEVTNKNNNNNNNKRVGTRTMGPGVHIIFEGYTCCWFTSAVRFQLALLPPTDEDDHAITVSPPPLTFPLSLKNKRLFLSWMDIGLNMEVIRGLFGLGFADSSFLLDSHSHSHSHSR